MATSRQPIVTLLTDFGGEDWFVGAMKGVLLSLLPSARIVDLSHAVPPGDLRRAAWILKCARPSFPPRTVHVAVVDPSVGTSRRIALLHAFGQIFLAPDNGVLSFVLAEAPRPRLYRLDRPDLLLPEVSSTFHGRDIFAPVAARLAAGMSPSAMGPRLVDPVLLAPPVLRRSGRGWEAEVTYVDRFGDATLSLARSPRGGGIDFPAGTEKMRVRIGGRSTILPLQSSYCAVEKGEALALWGSSGHLELAVNGGSAAARFGLRPGDTVFLGPAPTKKR